MSALDISRKTTFKPDACCDRPTVATMDHIKGYTDQEQRMVNRCCTRCWVHWYGPEGAVRRYSRQEWDAWIGASLCEDKPSDTDELRKERALLRKMRRILDRVEKMT